MQLGQWGIVDIEDAKSAAQTLINKGYAHEKKLVIMGGSAGGYSVLMALTQQADFWAGGISLYGKSALYYVLYIYVMLH
jgi:dipeptidyl aminopeptidase/acylaminoacyl peptidase